MAHASHQTTSPIRTQQDELIDIIWSMVKPCALKIGDMMHPFSVFRLPPGLGYPPPSSSPKLPSLAHRRAACTHLTMNRLYGSFTCMVCNRPSELGWVYVCTQDDNIQMGANERMLLDAPLRPSPVQHTNTTLIDWENEMKYGVSSVNGHQQVEIAENLLPTAELNPSVRKAIQEGQYTEEQIAILKAQKQHVFNVAKNDIEKFEESQFTTDITTQSIDSNIHLPFPLVHDVRDLSTSNQIVNEGDFVPSKTKIFPHCKYRACQLCRPTHRDRTWQRFEDVFTSTSATENQSFGDNTRPLASVSVMRDIGLRPTPRGRPLRQLNALREMAARARNEAISEILANNNLSEREKSERIMAISKRKTVATRRSKPSTVEVEEGESSEIPVASLEPESKGFRESVKRAFRGMLASRNSQPRRSGRKKRTESETSEEDAAEFDMGLWKEMNDELLKEASNVPLPVKDSLDSFSDYGDGERRPPTKECTSSLSNQVEEGDIAGVGVAVTEEAAYLGSADIIMPA